MLTDWDSLMNYVLLTRRILRVFSFGERYRKIQWLDLYIKSPGFSTPAWKPLFLILLVEIYEWVGLSAMNHISFIFLIICLLLLIFWFWGWRQCHDCSSHYYMSIEQIFILRSCKLRFALHAEPSFKIGTLDRKLLTQHL